MTENHTILIVEDDKEIQHQLSSYLASCGYETRSAGTAAEARDRLAADNVDLVVLDLGLPDKDGLELAMEIRSSSGIPIIIVTGRVDEIDRILGLEMGADDYVGKPFNPREIRARIKSVLRRSTTEPQPDTGPVTKIESVSMSVNLFERSVYDSNNKPIDLTTAEYDLLCILINKSGEIVDRREICKSVLHRDWDPLDRSVDVLMTKLRKKLLSTGSSPNLIKTVRGTGYVFTERTHRS